MSQSLWYPYTQMAHAQSHHRVVEASGCELVLESGERLIDGVSSWWSVIHGYRHPRLDAVAKAQLDQLAHVMLGGLVTGPAEALADALVDITPDGLNHVFFSDSGSVGGRGGLEDGDSILDEPRTPRAPKIYRLREGVSRGYNRLHDGV